MQTYIFEGTKYKKNNRFLKEIYQTVYRKVYKMPVPMLEVKHHLEEDPTEVEFEEELHDHEVQRRTGNIFRTYGSGTLSNR